ncbi:hypothetical protein BHM03_00009792 [Ensete ventricosum]|uniref:Uncharacterized protein n=2 Tax=Ensete ventricosum TaxID=4639 RepID=A0A445MCW1_ENSVE|nr:hypothetical protein BHM03_00009792 [Ensete ventricosum]
MVSEQISPKSEGLLLEGRQDYVPMITPEQYASRSALLSALVVAWSPVLQSSQIRPGFSNRYSILAVGGKSGKISLWKICEPECYTVEHGRVSVDPMLIGLIQAHNSWITAISWEMLAARPTMSQLIMATGNLLCFLMEFILLLQLSLVSDQCFGLALSPGGLTIAVYFEDADNPLVPWDSVAALLEFKKYSPSFVENLLFKWISGWFSCQLSDDSIDKILLHVVSMLSEISSRKIFLLNIICRRLMISDPEADMHNGEQLKSSEPKNEGKFAPWRNLLVNNELELQQRAVSFTFRAVLGHASQSSDAFQVGKKWFPVGVAQMECWVLLNAGLVHNQLNVLGSELRGLGSSFVAAAMSSPPHVLVLPFPAQGHVVSFMALSHGLVEQGFRITFVNTEFNHGRVAVAMSDEGRDAAGRRIRMVAIPDGLAPGDDRNDLG